MKLKDRIGVDTGNILPIEEAIRWAAANDVKYLDVQCDFAPNDQHDVHARASAIRALVEETDIHLGLHTVSGVNIAERSPFVADAADEYLRSYIDLQLATGAEWVIVHAGYHFTGDYEARRVAGLERLKRAADYAEQKGALLLLENTNREPKDAEVQYLACTIEECLYYFDNLKSDALRFAFTANHAHLYDEGVAGFVDALDMVRAKEVRLADNHGDVEIHLKPGEGNMDFGDMFRRIEAAGFTGHYMNQFGTLEDMLDARDWLVDRAREAGVT
ncbi:sugar phosphate isomerase/epimerase [Rhodobacteraceae bacterium 2376]|uniref:Sugar phosphate isomerase/epimerase n=1 Tax=Rhabdonatronobacter sediminivivens TaxID=2743469 RepID=A0A7Z0HY04_9RHOB|nr:TIM barrel protein [Rhabdonatronobacter sediminivivens]NYS24265.1 sugar phosphate isomerase/epimerase [Rhabdonatronobacter sediminivivens]